MTNFFYKMCSAYNIDPKEIGLSDMIQNKSETELMNWLVNYIQRREDNDQDK